VTDYTGRKALIVEDQEMFREAIAFEMESLGFSVSTAIEGQDAFRKLSAEPFDIVLSDVKMPNWDGKRLLQEVRSESNFLPFVFMSGFTDLSLPEALNQGADAFIGKPFHLDKLLETIARLLPEGEQIWSREKVPESVKHLERRENDNIPAPANGQILLGRRGLCLALRPEETGLAVDDRVTIDFRFAEGPVKELKGQATVAWKHFDSKASLLGITFDYLEAVGRDQLIAYLQSAHPKASIPFLKMT
jgi:DNA-binding response OmpR family regulator